MLRRRRPAVGAQPGTLVIHDEAAPPTINVMKYRTGHLEEHAGVAADSVAGLLEDGAICWVDVHGLGDEGVLRSLARVFSIHPLALEDVVNVHQRPKVEPYEHNTFCVTRMILTDTSGQLHEEQVSVFVGTNYVVTFQERTGDVFDAVRTRIRQGGPIMRSMGPGYLAYALVDAVIDGYFPVVEHYADRLEVLEDEVIADPHAELVERIHDIKRELLALRRVIWPQREALGALIRSEAPQFGEAVRIYLRDSQDHCAQLLDVVETYRELAAGLMDAYLSTVGIRQNEVMKVLTVMASIFIPLTFLAGIYGMNFDHMPELHARWAYPLLLAVMAVVAGAMLLYFRRRGWLGGQRD